MGIKRSRLTISAMCFVPRV